MHDSLKKICKGLEKEMEEYAQHMSDGRHQMHEKDAERLKNLSVALCAMKMLKMLEGVKQDGENKMGHGIGGMMDTMKKHGMDMGNMMNTGIPPIPGFTNKPYEDEEEMRRGVPGTGRRRRRYEYDPMDTYNYEDDDDDMEMRRGVPGTGRRRRRRYEMDNQPYGEVNQPNNPSNSPANNPTHRNPSR